MGRDNRHTHTEGAVRRVVIALLLICIGPAVIGMPIVQANVFLYVPLLAGMSLALYTLIVLGPSVYRYGTSTREVQVLRVTRVTYCAWEDDRPRRPRRSKRSPRTIYGSEVLFEGESEAYRLPTRYLREGDTTRRLILKKDGVPWAYRWLDI